MIPAIVKVPVALAQQIAGGVIHLGVSCATSLLRRVLPDSGADVSTERAPEPPAPVPKAPAPKEAAAKQAVPKKAVAKKAVPKKAVPKKTVAKKAAPKKPAAALDEPVAPVDEDPIVYSSGPEVAASIPVEGLESVRLTKE